MSKIQVVIMAGGAGTRFWPFSTPERPKQFMDLTGEGSMIQLTVDRLEGLVDVSQVWVMTNQEYVDLVCEICPKLSRDQVIGEPMMRDTSAAIALAGGLIHHKDEDAVMVVLPADHVIRDSAGFQQTLKHACELAEQDQFVTIGIQPTYPAETFGYLQKGAPIASQKEGAFQLESFVEKPKRELAEQYLESGHYAWNAGMFVWKVDNLLDEIKKHLPEHAKMAETLKKGPGEEGWQEKARNAFESLEKISIDFGLMEKLNNLCMVEAKFDWNDVGGWLALESLIKPDEHNNTKLGKTVTRDAQDNIIVVEDGLKPAIVAGIRDSVIVCSKSGTLVCSKFEVERIKDLVNIVLGKK